VSTLDLRPNPQETSSFYLGNIYEVLATSNVSRESIPSTIAKPPPFSPPTYAIWVNSLWWLSLVISLTTATMAASLQEWARRYIRITRQPQSSPEKQARIRAVIANGPEKRFLLWGADGLSTYLHLSVFLFVAGAVIFLYNVNHIVFSSVVWWVGCSVLAYAFFTLVPIFKSDILLYTPLSRLALPLCLVLSSAVFQVCSCIPRLNGLGDDSWKCYRALRDRWHTGLLKGTRKAAEETASKPSSKIDTLVVERILLGLGEDQTLEQFFDTIPGFCNSPLVNGRLPYPVSTKFQQTLDGFLDRTLSSNSVSEIVRSRRLIICLDAAHAALGSDRVSRILYDILNGRWSEMLQSVEMGHTLRHWGDKQFSSSVRRVVSRIVFRVPERDDRWIALVKDEFGIPDGALRDYIAHGDSVLLAILNLTIRQLFHSNSSFWDLGILQDVSYFDINNTLPRLQQDFCALWNEIVQEARKRGAWSTPALILGRIHHIHTALHQDSNAALAAYSDFTADGDNTLFDPLLYPLCGVGDHRPDSTPPVEKAPARNTVQPFATTSSSHDVSSLYVSDHACTLPAAEPSSVSGFPPFFTPIRTPSSPILLKRHGLLSTPPDVPAADASRRNSGNPSFQCISPPVDAYSMPAHSGCTPPAVFASSIENPLGNEPGTTLTPGAAPSSQPPPTCPSRCGFPRF